MRKNKGSLTKLKLEEGLVYCLSNYGIQGTTFQSVADHCEVSQASVVKYFKNREALIWAAFEWLLNEAQAKTEVALKTPNLTSIEMLDRYIDVSMDIFYSKKETSKIYILMYYLSSHDPKFLKFNTELKKTAVSRIQNILEIGKQNGELVFSQNSELIAKLIHNNLSGLLINSVTELPSCSTAELASLMRLQLYNFLMLRLGDDVE
jgi:AcrR family transcriptional regulator